MAADLSGELREAILASAGRLGISPSDLATAISYETGGTFDPWKAGPTTQWGQHRGLIQWGEPQRRKYGVTAEMPVADQLRAAERYLTDAGVKPGHGLLDIYSAINAGRVGLYDRSDANNGGAPGTVADKVASMAGHRMRANALLGLDNSGILPTVTRSAAAPGAIPMSMAPAIAAAEADKGDLGGLDAALTAMAKLNASREQEMPRMRLDPIRYAHPPGLKRARAIARMAGNQALG